MPHFSGRSYLIHSSPGQAQGKLQVDLTLLPNAANGLVLFAESSGGGHFSISLLNGFALFQLKYNSSTANLTSTVKLITGHWHVVSVGSSQNSSFISINNTFNSSADSAVDALQLNLDSPLFVGGVADLSILPSVVMVTSGFTGCIRDLQINRAPVDIVSDALGGQAIRSCPEPECSYVQCQNGGTCVSTANGAGFMCQCSHGYGGKLCEVLLPLCSPNPCLFGGECQEFGERVFSCLCPLNRGGRLCGEGKLVTVASPCIAINSPLPLSLSQS